MAYLAGTWHLARVVADRRAGRDYRMVGTAWYTPTLDGLHYTERVRWTAPDGRPLDGHRCYRLIATGPWSAELRFADGRYFHALDLHTGAAEVAHTCPPDRYAGWYALAGPEAHRTGWTVTGPRKALTIVSTYTRQRHAAENRSARGASLE